MGVFCRISFLMISCAMQLDCSSLVYHAPEQSASPGSTAVQNAICESEAYREAAKHFSYIMNVSADPCEDFYNYACGNWIATNKIPDDETDNSLSSIVFDDTQLLIQELLASKKDDMFPSEAKAKLIFEQCKNQEEVERLGASPLLDLLNETLGGWPILNTLWNASNFNPLTSLAKIQAYGVEPLFSIKVGQDLSIPADNIVYVSEASSFTSKEVLLSSAAGNFTDSQMILLANVTSLLLRAVQDPREISEQPVWTELTEILELGRYIAISKRTALEDRDLNSYKNKTTLGANQAKTFTRSAIFRNMTNLLKSLFEPVQLADQINSTTLIVLRNAKYFDLIDEKLLQLEKLGDKGKRQLANYMGWRLIVSNLQSLGHDFRTLYEENEMRVNGKATAKQKSADERCATDVVSTLPLAVGAVYVRDYIPADLRSKASMMVNDIKLGFGELLNEATWMDNVTHSTAVKKLHEMLSLVGYPDILVNNISAVDAEYKDATVELTYFRTLQKLNKMKVLKYLKTLVVKNKRDDPFENPLDVTSLDAHNEVFNNLIVVAAGMLQPPFYNTKYPEYLNYGGMGFVLGHEITHGFDDQGSQADEEGRMRVWWTNETTVAYNAKIKTFVDQYNAFNLSAGQVNGELTLGENIADNGGLKAAYRAYFNHFQKRLPVREPLLPGFETSTAEKMFFLSAAQMWCGIKRPEAEAVDLLTNVHSPWKFRVNGPVSNMPEFATAFRCNPGSKMNPTLKRSVW